MQSLRAGVQVELVGGLDISYENTQAAAPRAVATYVLLRMADLSVVSTLHDRFHATEPYVCGFLAFREVAAYQRLIHRAKQLDVSAQVQPSFPMSLACMQAQHHCTVYTPSSPRRCQLVLTSRSDTSCGVTGSDGGRRWHPTPQGLWGCQPSGSPVRAAHHRRGQEPAGLGGASRPPGKGVWQVGSMCTRSCRSWPHKAKFGAKNWRRQPGCAAVLSHGHMLHNPGWLTCLALHLLSHVT